MPDYIREIQNGTMMIRDTGGDVQFWFKTGSSTFNNQQTWGFQANGAYSEQDYRLARGGAWQMFGSVYVGSDQDVMFRIIGEGLGWPTTDHYARIERLQIPPAPSPPSVWNVGSGHVTIGWGGDGGAGGASVTVREIWYSYDGTPRFLASGDGSRQTVGGLSPGTYYNFWARNGNAKGISGFSGATLVRTLRVPDAPNPIQTANVRQTNLDVAFNFDGRDDGGTPVREWQIGYGLNPNTPTTYVSSPNLNIAGLSPGRLYYFWGRARNDIGWGPWTARADVYLLAGAWVKVGGVWRRALPWVKVNGVWKVGQPNIPLNGTWKVPIA